MLQKPHPLARGPMADCRLALRPTCALVFACAGGAAAIDVNVDLENCRRVDEAINGCKRHGGVWKNLPPATDGWFAVMAPELSADDLEQDGGVRLALLT